MNFESVSGAQIEHQAPRSETLALRLIRMRALSDPKTDETLQSLISDVYNEVTASIAARPSVGQVSNRVRGQILSALNNNPDTSAYQLVMLAKRLIREAARNKPS